MGQMISGVAETEVFRPPFAPGSQEASKPSVLRPCQKRVGLPGIQTQAYRPTGGISSSQRQQDQLTPEITRWQKASTKTLPTETKATWQHQNPVFPPQQVPEHPNTPEKQESLI